MTHVPPHRWFHFHLATALVLTVACGGMLWANMLERQGQEYITLDNEEATVLVGMRMRGESPRDCYSIRGFPFWFHQWYDSPMGDQFAAPLARFRWLALAVDILACIALAVIAAVVSEALLRRRESRTS